VYDKKSTMLTGLLETQHFTCFPVVSEVVPGVCVCVCVSSGLRVSLRE
jgi:hypothetical protein